MITFGARQILTPDGPIDGWITLDSGRIAALGTAPVADAIELGDTILCPGLINAHTHVELSWLGAEPLPEGDYERWLRGLLERQAAAPPLEQRKRAAEAAIDAMEARGIVAVGDIANELWVADVWAQRSFPGWLFWEQLGRETGQLDERFTAIDEALTRLPQLPLRCSPTPHATHTTSGELLRWLSDRAAAQQAPLSIHLAESLAETAFHRGEGPFVALFEERGFGAPPQPAMHPVAWAATHGALTPATLAVHVVQLDTPEIDQLVASGCTVVTCPRSNRQLGVGVAPLEELHRRGVRWAIGTDSLASAPDLDLWNEMALLRDQHPTLSARAIVDAATAGGAAALGLQRSHGRLEVGFSDAILALPADGEDPYETLCRRPSTVRRLDRSDER